MDAVYAESTCLVETNHQRRVDLFGELVGRFLRSRNRIASIALK
jgi:hypothetical protein